MTVSSLFDKTETSVWFSCWLIAGLEKRYDLVKILSTRSAYYIWKKKLKKLFKQVGSDEFHVPFDKHSITEILRSLKKCPVSHDSSSTVPDKFISLNFVRIWVWIPDSAVMSGHSDDFMVNALLLNFNYFFTSHNKIFWKFNLTTFFWIR